MTPAQALEAYGRYFVTYVYRQGYEKLLLCLGDSLPELLENLNNLCVALRLRRGRRGSRPAGNPVPAVH